MQELIDLALDGAQRAGAGYADIRLVERSTESLTVKNGDLAEASSDRSAGFGVRVLIDGAWGFAGSSRLEREEVERVTGEAVAIARASGLATREPIVLDDSPPAVAVYRTLAREGKLPLRVVEQVTLFDVSPVTYPAYEDTTVGARVARAGDAHHRERLLRAERAAEHDRRVGWLRRAEHSLSLS